MTQRHAKSQVPCPMPDVDSGVVQPRPKLPTGGPVPEVIGSSPRDALPIPRGAVKTLVRILRICHGSPADAAAVARHWARGTDDPRFTLLADLLVECATDPLIAGEVVG